MADAIDPEILRHSAAHILAQAVLRLFPGAKLGIGPVTDTGFYYDFELPDIDGLDANPGTQQRRQAETKLLSSLAKEINKIIEEELPFTQVFLQREEAMDMLHQQGQIYKTELLQQIPDPEVSFYKTGEEFIDLCRGPHVNSTSKVGAVKLKGITHAHWLGDDNRPLLVRINGMAFRNKAELAEHEKLQKELVNRDHRKVGEDLLVYSPANAQGSNDHLILSHGAKAKRLLLENFNSELEDSNFQLFETKPFWDKQTFINHSLAGFYEPEDVIDVNKDILLTNNQLISILDYMLSQKNWQSAENEFITGKAYYTNWQFHQELAKGQDDRGLYESASRQQLRGVVVMHQTKFKQQLRELIQLVVAYYRQLLGDRLSANIQIKDAEVSSTAVELLIETKLNVNRSSGEGDFMLSFSYLDIYEQSWELANINISQHFSDYVTANIAKQQPGRLKASNKREDGNGWLVADIEFVSNLELLLALLVEKTNGELPLAVAPYQAVIIPESDRFNSYAKNLASELSRSNLRVMVDTEALSYETKLKSARALKFPYILTVGEQEERNNVLSVKPADGADLGLMSTSEFLQKLGQIS
jgi:threonyl-tRNA synthetase